MSKMILAGAFSFLALSAMGMSSFVHQQFAIGVGVDPMVTGGVPQTAALGSAVGDSIAMMPNTQIPDADMFILTGEQSDELCIFERAPLAGQRTARIHIDADCAPLYPALTSAVHWREREGGLIDLVDEAGKTVATFTNTDGVSFVTMEPSSIHLTFSPI